MTGADGGPAWAQGLLDHLRPTGRDIRRVVARLAEAVQGTARQLRLVRVKPPPAAPVGVLAVSRPAPFDRRTSEIVTHSAQVAELLLRARESTAAGRSPPVPASRRYAAPSGDAARHA